MPLASLTSVKNSRTCFGCGKENAAGLQLDFELREDGRLETRFTPRDIHGGWEGLFHGGLMATLLDEAMMAYLYLNGVDAATASLDVRFRKPVALGEELVVHAWSTESRRNLFRTTAEARRNGELVASATARCLAVAGETRRDGGARDAPRVAEAEEGSE